MFSKRGEERNYGVLIASIVAIVAIVGMVVYFSGGSLGQGAAVAYSAQGEESAAQCVGTGEDYTKCIVATCGELCQGSGDLTTCSRYCTGRARSIARD
ncbi:MAG: hypothetical protein AABX52_03965 [Nanoarchaeota archaeon]